MRLTKRVECSQDDCRCSLEKAPTCQMSWRFRRMRNSCRSVVKERKSMARIRHLAILTEDVEKLVKFYTTAFGLKIVHGVGTATYLSDGHINLAIIPIGPEREIEGPHLQLGINHFGFEVED